jgi:signal transduction histidine kinase
VSELIANADFRTERARISWQPGPGSKLATTAPTKGDGFAADIHAVEGPLADGTPALFSRVPVALPGGGGGEILIRESLHERDAYLHESAMRTLAAIALLIVLCFVVISAASWVLLRRPMQALFAKLDRVGRGDLSGPIPVVTHDELGMLAEALNLMCVRLEALQTSNARATEARIAALDQLRHANRLTTAGTLASGIAHELGTPLNVIAARGKMIAQSQVPADQVGATAEVIIEQAERMARIIRQLLDFVRLRSPRRRLENIHSLCARNLEFLQQLAAKRGVQLELSPAGSELQAEVDAAQLQQVLTNLVVNAVHAQPNGGVVAVTISAAKAAPDGGPAGADELLIGVKDQGAGMPLEVRERLFEPFFTTKGVGEGTGLGLAVAHGIVTEHGGRIDVESTPGTGSTFTVHLPMRTA